MAEASDGDVADFLIKHIDNPCKFEIHLGHWVNVREDYLREAERFLPTMTDPVAKDRLQKKVDQYRGMVP